MGSAIEIRGVSKRYELGEAPAVYGTLREALSRPFGRRADRWRRELWALRALDLDVEQGELLGVIGRNGAGKTTLLKLVSRITEPTEGVVRVRGRVGTLLEVGTGFHPELTGRENILLNGAILGMSRAEIRGRFEAIVDFAGIDPVFLETPLKRYSMGMRLRLAFAIAAHLESDVMLVDEVLAVGDAEFQRRCTGAISELAERGRTVLFASHDLATVARLCERAIQLDAGRVVADGPAADVIAGYRQALADSPVVHAPLPAGAGPVRITAAEIRGEPGPSRGDPLTVTLRVEVGERIAGLHPAVILRDARGVAVINEIWERREHVPAFAEPGAYEVSLTIPPILTSGEYSVEGWIGTRFEDFVHAEILSFVLQPLPGDPEDHALRPRLIEVPDSSWRVRRV